jgi:hypothetical protein
MKLNITTKALETFLDNQLQALFALVLNANPSLMVKERRAHEIQLVLTTTEAVGMAGDSGLYERTHDVLTAIMESQDFITRHYGRDLRVGRVELVKALVAFITDNNTERIEEFGNDWMTLASGCWLGENSGRIRRIA